LKKENGLSLPELLSRVNLSRGRVDKTIALLCLEAPAPIARHAVPSPALIRRAAPVIEKLEHLVDDLRALQSKLVLLIGPPQSGKTVLLHALAKRRGLAPLNVGSELGRRLAAIPRKQRHLQTNAILRDLTDQHASGDLLLLDNIEILFDRSLQLDPLDLLKRHAHARRVVAVWPGELQGDTRTGRLTYADMGHPEHRDYALTSLIPFEIQ
jgi:hypothetical protein